MTKDYIKPAITFQPLSMSSDLSSGCSFTALFQEFMCPFLIPEWGETVFTEGICDWSNEDYYICYHVPTPSVNVFNS